MRPISTDIALYRGTSKYEYKLANRFVHTGQEEDGKKGGGNGNGSCVIGTTGVETEASTEESPDITPSL